MPVETDDELVGRKERLRIYIYLNAGFSSEFVEKPRLIRGD
jgi:hypothetical protein